MNHNEGETHRHSVLLHPGDELEAEHAAFTNWLRAATGFTKIALGASERPVISTKTRNWLDVTQHERMKNDKSLLHS